MVTRRPRNGIQTRTDLDTNATSRAEIGMIFGLAMIGLNPALDLDEKTKTVQAAIRLMLDGISNHRQQSCALRRATRRRS